MRTLLSAVIILLSVSSVNAICLQPYAPPYGNKFAYDMYKQQMQEYQACLMREEVQRQYERQMQEMQRQLNNMRRY